MKHLLILVSKEKLYLNPAGVPRRWFDIQLSAITIADLVAAVDVGLVRMPPPGGSFFELTDAGAARLVTLAGE